MNRAGPLTLCSKAIRIIIIDRHHNVNKIVASRLIMLLLLLLTCTIILLPLSFMCMDNNTARAQQQQLTNQGTPIAIIPGLTQNVLTIASFLIGTSSFILGLRIPQSQLLLGREYFRKSSHIL